MHRRIALVMITMAVFFITACHRGSKQGGPTLVLTWAYTPHAMAVHPLSRFKVRLGEKDPEEIIVHVVFKDGDDYQCRAVGTLVLTLSGNNIKDTVKSIDLGDDETNRERFDGLTRTYHVHFSEVPQELSKVRVTATFTPDTGDKLRASATIEK